MSTEGEGGGYDPEADLDKELTRLEMLGEQIPECVANIRQMLTGEESAEKPPKFAEQPMPDDGAAASPFDHPEGGVAP